jgi:3-phenylpropionate/trans-cinnamate dioxygenase ferredoxin component
MTWQPTGIAAETVREGTMRELLVDGRSVVVALVRGSLVAFDGYCPHQGGLLAEGRLDGDRLTCPVHEAAFALPSGEVRADPFGVEPPAGGVGPLPVYPVRVTAGSVEVDVPSGT